MADLFDDWYVDEVDVDTLLSVDEVGAETVQTHLSVRCAVDDTTQLVIGPDGTDEMSSARVQFEAAALPWLTLGSTLHRDGWGPRGRIVITVSPSITGDPDLDGVTVAVR